MNNQIAEPVPEREKQQDVALSATAALFVLDGILEDVVNTRKRCEIEKASDTQRIEQMLSADDKPEPAARTPADAVVLDDDDDIQFVSESPAAVSPAKKPPADNVEGLGSKQAANYLSNRNELVTNGTVDADAPEPQQQTSQPSIEMPMAVDELLSTVTHLENPQRSHLPSHTVTPPNVNSTSINLTTEQLKPSLQPPVPVKSVDKPTEGSGSSLPNVQHPAPPANDSDSDIEIIEVAENIIKSIQPQVTAKSEPVGGEISMSKRLVSQVEKSPAKEATKRQKIGPGHFFPILSSKDEKKPTEVRNPDLPRDANQPASESRSEDAIKPGKSLETAGIPIKASTFDDELDMFDDEGVADDAAPAQNGDQLVEPKPIDAGSKKVTAPEDGASIDVEIIEDMEPVASTPVKPQPLSIVEEVDEVEEVEVAKEVQATVPIPKVTNRSEPQSIGEPQAVSGDQAAVAKSSEPNGDTQKRDAPDVQPAVPSDASPVAGKKRNHEALQDKQGAIENQSKTDSRKPRSPIEPGTGSGSTPKRARHAIRTQETILADGPLFRKELINSAFSGRVEFSAFCGHRIIAHVGGRELTGWVLDADISNVVNRLETVKEKKKESERVSSPLLEVSQEASAINRRKLPVSRTARKATPLAKHSGPRIEAPGPLRSPKPIVSTDVPRRSVIVIGAGIAGIAAARALQDRGFNVTILEGRSRIGGRISTDWSMGCPVDLGAAFIHGAYGNPLMEIAREADLRTYSPGDLGTLFYADGRRVNQSTDRNAENVWKALLRRAGTIAKGDLLKHKKLDIALGKLLNRLKNELVDGCNEEMDQLLAWHSANLEYACASELQGLSAKHYDMDDTSGFSGSHRLLRDGYASIVHGLANGLNIRFGATVSVIERDVLVQGRTGDKPSSKPRKQSFGSRKYHAAVIEDLQGRRSTPYGFRYIGAKKRDSGKSSNTEDEEGTSQQSCVRVVTQNGREYVAESCIVTIPLGVLQQGDMAFTPPLPAWKHNAIHNIGFGLVNKVVMRFETPFWANKEVRGEDEDEEGPDHIGRVSDEHGVFYMFLSLVRCVGAPVLVAITSGKFAEHIENTTDDQVVQMALDALTKMYPKSPPSRLVAHVVTRWKTDKFARGSYSFAKVGTTPSHYTEMAEPLGMVGFAGEATHRNHPATAHGAFMSGIREAARVIDRSGFSEDERRKYARELFLMQDPHASFERVVSTGRPKEKVKQNGEANGTSKSRSARRRR